MHILSALLLCAVGTLASKPQPHIPAAPRTHNTLAMRLRGPANATSREISGNGMEMGKRDSYTGVVMTWYPTNTGPTRTREEHGWMRSWRWPWVVVVRTTTFCFRIQIRILLIASTFYSLLLAHYLSLLIRTSPAYDQSNLSPCLSFHLPLSADDWGTGIAHPLICARTASQT
ncbi:hypothetical protein DFH06DRAFT_1370175 [Mycena polygramma]|nr:hypothetical protein DFH06DRAFT_1370175 [Mycena polygramma]